MNKQEFVYFWIPIENVLSKVLFVCGVFWNGMIYNSKIWLYFLENIDGKSLWTRGNSLNYINLTPINFKFSKFLFHCM